MSHYLKPDGKLYELSHKQIGYVKTDGKVYNVTHKHIENISNIEKKVKDSRHIKSYILLAVYNFLIKPYFLILIES